jgi:hypothetical protein
MRRRRTVSLALLLVTMGSLPVVLPATAGAAPSGSGSAAQATCGSSFESGFEGWQPDSDGLARDWAITLSREQASDGVQSLRYWTDGTTDDGTVWVERQLRVQPFRTVTVDVSFDLWSEFYSDFNRWPVVAFAGARNPAAEADFVKVGEDWDHVGWKRYSLRQTVRAGQSGRIWVAYGVSVVWETQRTHFVDCATVAVS